MPVPEIVTTLVQRFHEHSASLHSPLYNEAQLRQEYLNPFFEALGWDVYNKKEFSVQYREVVHEDSIHVKGSPTAKAPDYAFRLGGVRKFFVEAKKPAEDIENTKEYAYQLKSYAWSLGLPLSILTDFEEFAVYDCRNKPNPSDSTATSRVLYIRYDQYEEKWDEIAEIFSPQGIQRGAFDRYVADNTAKKGTIKVDDAFLADIETWRTTLARNIALRNSEVINERRLNFAVQMTIDRIIFLRICEDRGIEPEKQLHEISSQKDIYNHLLTLFQKADLKYNSGLFHFRVEKGNGNKVDNFTPTLSIDDKVLKEIIRSLYYPCPYVFKEIPVEILGQVYEQFLGKVIRLTAGKQAKIEEKPEVRKAGGVYYTPKYIVDYIVANTVGKLLEGKTPAEASKLRIVDPACGSGSFLLGAFQLLMDWHEKWYQENDLEKWTKGKDPTLVYTDKGDLRLSTSEKKRILTNNIYGVDIDAQAVEVTKLSLLLKVLEEETGQLTLGFERVLPNLDENIKCGNSLIGWDYFQGQLLPDEKEKERINPFDWQSEFTQVFSEGGFTAVIGNPPWISLSGKFGAGICTYDELSYLVSKYNGNTYMPNIYEYFVRKGFDLLRPNGFFSFIVPDRLGFNKQFVELRKYFVSNGKLINLIYKTPFPGVTADTLIFVVQNSNSTENHTINISEFNKDSIQYRQSDISILSNFVFSYFENRQIQSLINTIESRCQYKLKDVCETTSGFGGKSNLMSKMRTNEKQILTVKGESIGRYQFHHHFYFNFERKNITGRTTDVRKLGAKPKILLRKTGLHIIATFDDTGIFPEQSLYFLFNAKIPINFYYLLGILNSKLLDTYYSAKSLTNKQSIAQVKKVDLDKLPIFVVNSNNAEEVNKHDQIVVLVQKMLALNNQNSLTPREQEFVKRQIDATDAEIDRLVYEIYDLSDDDIEIIEQPSNI